MFQSARLKLTFWYFIVISSTSLAYSAIIYRAVVLELERGFVVAETRMRNQSIPRKFALALLSGELESSKKTVLTRLLFVDGFITFTATAVGYFLAGKTLRPIEEANEDQKRFIADASHELKTPLTALQTTTEVALMDKGMTLSDAKKVLRDNLEEIEKMKNLTTGLLSLTRHQENFSDQAKSHFRLDHRLVRVVINFNPLADDKSIIIKTRFTKTAVLADEKNIESLISILLDNAIKFTKNKGKIKVASSIKNKCAVITIKDNGIGIEPQSLTHIFDRFYQAEKSRSKGLSGGFGLGLSIAKQITDSMRGSISVDSKPDRGSTFSVKLPILS